MLQRRLKITTCHNEDSTVKIKNTNEAPGRCYKDIFILQAICMCACGLSHFSCVQLCATLWTVACQTPLSMRFSRQEYWSGLPCPPPGHLPNSGIEPTPLAALTWAGGFLSLVPPGKPRLSVYMYVFIRKHFMCCTFHHKSIFKSSSL